MKVIFGVLGVIFGFVYLLVALFMVLFIALMIQGGFILLMKALGVEL